MVYSSPLMKSSCLWCNVSFSVKVAEINRGNGKFCSLSCSAYYRNKNVPRSTNPKHMNAVARRTWKRRHNDAEPLCRICAKKADIHHIDGNPANNDPNNLDRLCRSHHASLENSIKPRKRCKDYVSKRKHGTRSYYSAGCRCVPCSDAARLYR